MQWAEMPIKKEVSMQSICGYMSITRKLRNIKTTLALPESIPSLKAIRNLMSNTSATWEIEEKVTSLKNKSSSLQMPVNILKNTIDVCLIFLTYLLHNIVDDCDGVNDCEWPIEFGSADITTAIKRSPLLTRKIIVQLVFCIQYQKFLKNYPVTSY